MLDFFLFFLRVNVKCLSNLHSQNILFNVALAPYSPSAASSPQEPSQATTEADLPVITTREQKLLKWQNLHQVFSSAVQVCVASMAVTLVIMAALGIHAFIKCPKQVSQLAQGLIKTNSDFTKVLAGCSKERMDINLQLRNATFNLIIALNEMKDVTKILENCSTAGHSTENFGLIECLIITTHNYTSLLKKAVQDLMEIQNNFTIVDAEKSQAEGSCGQLH